MCGQRATWGFRRAGYAFEVAHEALSLPRLQRDQQEWGAPRKQPTAEERQPPSAKEGWYCSKLRGLLEAASKVIQEDVIMQLGGQAYVRGKGLDLVDEGAGLLRRGAGSGWERSWIPEARLDRHWWRAEEAGSYGQGVLVEGELDLSRGEPRNW